MAAGEGHPATAASAGVAAEGAPAPDTFELGLVLAGAVSAGAYTAGVLDFLFEALDAWTLAKENGEDVPDHDVVLRVVTGASAGGMNGAVAASALHYDFPHVRAKDGPDHNNALGNPFYAAWVKNIDMRLFLELADLETKPLPSLLDSSRLEDVVRSLVGYRGPRVGNPGMRRWLANPLRVLLTVSNLRGVPYSISFNRGEAERGHRMLLHQDHVGFAVEGISPRPPEAVSEDLSRLPAQKVYDGAWRRLGLAALATGAFPGFLAARLLDRPPADYNHRFPPIEEDGQKKPWEPSWEGTPEDPYRFLCVDGGAMNNEPFELAHAVLAGARGMNPWLGSEARRAVVMIDPLTNPARLEPVKPVSIPRIAGMLMNSLIQQARFTPSQYALATDKSVYSRFMIAPSRGEDASDSALAGAGLGAFLGFFSEAYRRHDFLLGRRNCQRFLSEWFTLPADNPLFKDKVGAWSAAKRQRFASEKREDHYQIIPLVGACGEEAEALPDWPAGRFRRDPALTKLIERRVRQATAALADELLAAPGNEGMLGWLQRQGVKAYLRVGLFFARRKIVYMVNDYLDAAVTAIDERYR